MGASNQAPPPQPGVYRDDPDRDDAASTSSAVLLEDIDYPDEELPPYTDEPAPSAPTSNATRSTQPLGLFESPPELPFSSHDLKCSEYRTRFPNYSNERTPYNKCGYRGGRITSLKPTLSNDLEGAQGEEAELRAWCEKYVEDKSRVKAFTLKREVTNHDTKKLEQLLCSAIQETNYRGHLEVQFPVQHKILIVYSPGFINNWRTTVWVRWVFYISMLWILSWPLLIALTARYEIVKAVYPYASKKPGDDVDRVPTVMSEVDWFHRLESTIKRAALARMRCEETTLGEEYRRQTEEADRRGVDYTRSQEVRTPSTGNTFADGALGVLGQGLRIAESFSNARGWGADC